MWRGYLRSARTCSSLCRRRPSLLARGSDWLVWFVGGSGLSAHRTSGRSACDCLNLRCAFPSARCVDLATPARHPLGSRSRADSRAYCAARRRARFYFQFSRQCLRKLSIFFYKYSTISFEFFVTNLNHIGCIGQTAIALRAHPPGADFRTLRTVSVCGRDRL